MKFSPNLQLNSLAAAFVVKYKSFDIKSLDLEQYNKTYVLKYLENIEYNTYLACELLNGIDQVASYDKIIDFGGGIGFNSAFYSYIGFKEVVYIDIDPISTKDAQLINTSMGFKNIDYRSGDYSLLTDYNLDQSIVCSRDVIEHVYDLKEFFSVTSKAKTNRHNTAAVSNAIFRSKEFARIHYTAEHVGNKKSIIKSRDNSLPYKELRESIIQEFNPNISKEKLNEAVSQTRGLIKSEIIAFLKTGLISENNKSILGTNTCDPNTGNWAERTLSFRQYQKLAEEAGVSLEFSLAKYNTFNQSFFKRFALAILNKTLNLTENERLCPSFTLQY